MRKDKSRSEAAALLAQLEDSAYQMKKSASMMKKLMQLSVKDLPSNLGALEQR